jgi:diguanylate cyclase (GGDEF)-like protein
MTKRNLIFFSSLVATIVIGYFDFLTPHISLMLLYTVPIFVSAWYCGSLRGIFIAVCATAGCILDNVVHRLPREGDHILLWNAVNVLGIFILVAYTVSLQVQLRRALERECLRADTDRLTGLFNKVAFRERMEVEIIRARRYNHPLSIAFIDLDNFKHVNDIHGHAHGDRLLQNVGELILHSIRKTDIAGRFGGDEFVVCYPEIDEHQLRKAVEKLIMAFDLITSQSDCQLTASIGALTCMDNYDTYDALLGKVDKLMYLAKEKGKNAVEYITV